MLLWKNGRKEGAWIQVLIAAAATSRIRFPGKRDGDAFRSFIREVAPVIMDENGKPVPGGVDICFYDKVRGDGKSLDQILYAQLRCTLLHEAIMPDEVKLCNSRLVEGRLVADLHGIGTKSLPLTIPDFWVIHLAKAVAEAPENAADCKGLFRSSGPNP